MNFFNYPPQLQRAFEALGLTILHSLWQGLLLMILLWALLRFIRYEKANLRFILAFGTLMLMLLAFTTTFYYEWDSLRPMATVSQSFSTESIPLTELQVSNEPSLWEEMRSEAYSLFYQLAENAHLLAIAWLAGSFLFSLRLSLGLWQIHQLRQERQGLTEFWKTKAFALQQALHIRRSVEVSTNSSLDTPITLGWLQPMILLPASMLTAMPAEQVESILVHELAHIRRHDYLWNLLQSMTEVILFYHPAYWYIASVLEQEREHACDAITLKITGRPQVYAQALLQVASLRTTLSAVGLSARGRSGFAERIRRIVAPQQKKKGVQPLPFLLSFCLIGFLLFAFTLKAPFEEQTAFVGKKEVSLTFDSLRAPDYVDYRYRLFDDKSLPEMLDYSSMNNENYIIGKAASEDEPVDVREYFNTSAIFLLDGVIVRDPKQIHISDIRRYEVYHEPIPTALQNLSERPYSSVVRAFSQMPEEIRESSHIRVGGQVFTSENNMRLPLSKVMVEVQSSGQKTTTNAQGKFSFPSVRKNDTILFYTPSYRKPTPVPVDGREYISIYTHIPKRIEDKTIDKLKQRMSPEKLKKDREVIKNRIGLMDSSIYDMMVGIILIDPKTNTAKINSNVPASQDDLNTYYTIGEPEVLFTLDGVVTDPRTVERKRVESASFETQNVPDGYVVEIRAISKEAAEAAKKESQKTIVKGTITDKNTGKPLPGTFILVKGSTSPTFSDLQGKYQIEVPEGSGELVFAYEGYKTRTELIRNSKTLEIAMLPEVKKEAVSGEKIAKGRVVDARTNKPVVGVEVYPMSEGKSSYYPAEKIEGINTFTDQNGEYQFIIPSHSAYLFHSHPDYIVSAVPAKYFDNSGTFPPLGDIRLIRLSSDNLKPATEMDKLLKSNALESDSNLYVIDGKPLKGKQEISHLKPEDIASVEVVKVKGNRPDQFEGLPIEGHDAVVFITTNQRKNDVEEKSKTVSGQVTDAETGQPIRGTNVLISGSKTGTVTDDKGKYQLQLTEDAQSLSFNSIGYQSQQIQIKDTERLDAKLLSLNAPATKPGEDSILFIVNNIPREDIASFEDLELLPEEIKSIDVRKGRPAKQWMTEAQKRKFNAAIKIETKNPAQRGVVPSDLENNLKVFPNPGNGDIKVSFSIPEAASVEFELLDNEGTFLTSFEYHFLSSGEQEIIIPVSKFPPDTYLLRINLNGEVVVKRVILK